MKPTHLVLRVIPGPQGQDVYGGTRVDASDWANTRLLEGAGYLRPLTVEELAEGDGSKPAPAKGSSSKPPKTPKPKR